MRIVDIRALLFDTVHCKLMSTGVLESDGPSCRASLGSSATSSSQRGRPSEKTADDRHKEYGWRVDCTHLEAFVRNPMQVCPYHHKLIENWMKTMSLG